MIDKVCSIDKAKEFIKNGYSIMVGGFGVPGTPFTLIDAVLKSGKKELILIKNEANEDGMGVSKLIEAGVAKKLITTHIGLNRKAMEMMNSGKIEVEFYPMGILAEKIRAGGSGILGFLTDIGIDTILRKGKQIIELNGREMFIEQALRSDVALIHASRADRFGNLVYEKSARNFNPIMAMAANKVIVEVESIVGIGELDPDQIHTPGVFVDHIVILEGLTDEYEILKRHVIGK
jgi:acetate CoA/acetoacetate CoA-transferase alpha subunit